MPTLGIDTLPSQRVPQKILKKITPYTISAWPVLIFLHVCTSASTRHSTLKNYWIGKNVLTMGVILFLQLQLPFSWWNPLTEAIFVSTHPPILQMVKLDVWNKHFRKFTILLLGGCESYIRILNCWFQYFPPSTSLSLRIKLFLVVMPTEERRLVKKKDCYQRTPGCRRKKTGNSWRAPVLGPTSKRSLQA